MDATASSTSSVDKIPICKVNAGPRSPEWPERLKEEYLSLIDYISHNKKNDKDWFNLESNKEGTEWKGRCWYIHEMVKYEFDLVFDIPATYPLTPIELRLPQLDGKTSKMYRYQLLLLLNFFFSLSSSSSSLSLLLRFLLFSLCACKLGEVYRSI
ncbi:ubiquitin-fold modifier-conjugating enzyme 1 [Cystoisospora suis]|uniref:Ubiquitin-fold modifier-conjugating enzyme 1 n=1 Tax=Cystoisospora suis TaxID=483139 RepID=A0A2C6KIE3_9APIC|nr:ubiquitin-fold modifier-conjugating enzyme 1 [Cystoisospora suis]